MEEIHKNALHEKEYQEERDRQNSHEILEEGLQIF